MNPSLGILSVGRNNIYGFPHEEVVERYNKRDIPLLRTDTHGAVEIVMHRFGTRISAFLPKSFKTDILSSTIVWTLLFYILLKNERNKEDEIYRWSEITKGK